MNKFLKILIVVLGALVLIAFTRCTKEVVKSNDITKLSEGQISLAVIIEAKPGKEEALKKALLAIVEPTRAEKGCIDYVLHTDPANKGRFMFYENWESKALWDVHLNSPHIKAFGEVAGDLVANQLDLTNWVIHE